MPSKGCAAGIKADVGAFRAMTWPETDLAAIRRRYRWVAPIYPLFNVVFGLPPGLRARAVARLALKPGGSVLEIGCGTGRNIPLLVKAVGPQGRVFGIDATEPMLRRARALCERRGYENVTLRLEDAAELTMAETVDAAFFSLSYSVMPREKLALEKAWACVRPGGRLVIMDASVERRKRGRLVRGYASALSRGTVLGNPFKRPWEDLEALAGSVETEEAGFGTYFVCTATER